MKTNLTSKLTIRRAGDRGHADHGWLESWHTFSFADYYDPAQMGYRSLRVINEDIIAPGQGFGMHPHESMEIFTYLIAGELEHQDSMGHGRTIKAGEFQYMSAGDGVLHAERNPGSEAAHLLQIWLTPKQAGGEPRYADLKPAERKSNEPLTLLASATGRDSSLQIRQHADISLGKLSAGALWQHPAHNDRPHLWLQMIQGRVQLAGQTLQAGDAVAIDHSPLRLRADEESEFLLFELE